MHPDQRPTISKARGLGRRATKMKRLTADSLLQVILCAAPQLPQNSRNSVQFHNNAALIVLLNFAKAVITDLAVGVALLYLYELTRILS
jgi:hypothetical protein